MCLVALACLRLLGTFHVGFRHMFILRKMYMQLEENTCFPITQYAYKQSTHLALLGKHAWSWLYRKCM